MPAASYDISIDRGATFTLAFRIKSGDDGVDLTGSTFTGQLRPTAGSAKVIATMTCTPRDQTNPTTRGWVDVTISAADTALIPTVDSGSPKRTVTAYAYDIVRTTGSIVERVLQGVANVSPRVTL